MIANIQYSNYSNYECETLANICDLTDNEKITLKKAFKNAYEKVKFINNNNNIDL